MNIENVAAYQGSYSGSATYNEGDIVTYNNATYLSLINSNTGNEPDTNPSDWVVLGVTGNLAVKYAHTSNASSLGISLPAGTFIVTLQIMDNSGGASEGPTASGQSSTQVAMVQFPLNGGVGYMTGVYTLSSASTLTISWSDSRPALLTAVQVN